MLLGLCLWKKKAVVLTWTKHLELLEFWHNFTNLDTFQHSNFQQSDLTSTHWMLTDSDQNIVSEPMFLEVLKLIVIFFSVTRVPSFDLPYRIFRDFILKDMFQCSDFHPKRPTSTWYFKHDIFRLFKFLILLGKILNSDVYVLRMAKNGFGHRRFTSRIFERSGMAA